MLLTISTTHDPATDLGYLLHKHPARVQTFELAFGKAHVFYPQADAERCTAALLLDVDPVALVRGRGEGRGGLLDQYVNDRPYVASSFLAVAIAKVFGSALGGRCKDLPELVGQALPLTATVAALPCRGGDDVVRRLFEPLGYAVSVAGANDAKGWHRNVTLEGRKPLAELLTHLYVLVPVLDNRKHYWVGDDEVQKLLDRGGNWLPSHPEKAFITRRYLKYKPSLAREALVRLADDDEAEESADGERTQTPQPTTEEALERPMRLHDQRMAAVAGVLARSGAARVLDLGCGEGRLLAELLPNRQFTELVGLDTSVVALEIAARRLRLDRMPPMQRQRVALLHGALTYRDRRLAGYDAAALIEVLEHFDSQRLAAVERVVFAFAQPRLVVVTTPNREYNANYPGLASGGFRHSDHRFEWTRDEFKNWARRVADEWGYEIVIEGIGEADPERGPPTQMGIFRRCE